MSDLDRRMFLKGAAAAAGTALLGGPFQGFVASASAAPHGHGRPLGYGRLAPAPDLRDGAERLLLPRGFRYRSFDVTGDRLTDGTPIPGRHDGMAAFRGRRGRSVLVRNHEVNGPVGAFGDRGEAYDPATGGGTTTVEVDRYGNVSRSGVSLKGTQMNCSGGPMPWGSWITCEETVNGPTSGPTSRAHRTPASPSGTATSSTCRPRARARGRPSAGRDGSRTRPRPGTTARRRSTLLRTTSPSRPASTGTARRRTQCAESVSPTADGCRCSP